MISALLFVLAPASPRVKAGEGAGAARVIAEWRHLNFDNARPEIAKHHRAIGTGKDARKIEYDRARQRACGFRL